MDYMDVSSSAVHQRRRDSYDTPRLNRLGAFRELTQCGTLLDIPLGRLGGDDCVFRGSSSYGWHRD